MEDIIKKLYIYVFSDTDYIKAYNNVYVFTLIVKRFNGQCMLAQ